MEYMISRYLYTIILIAAINITSHVCSGFSINVVRTTRILRNCAEYQL